ncbi:peptidase [Escherichia coli]|nr:peptidase [Escherichia coli]
MKIRALLVAMSVATVLTGCQNMDSNGLLSSGAEAFQAYSLSDAQVKNPERSGMSGDGQQGDDCASQ